MLSCTMDRNSSFDATCTTAGGMTLILLVGFNSVSLDCKLLAVVERDKPIFILPSSSSSSPSSPSPLPPILARIGSVVPCTSSSSSKLAPYTLESSSASSSSPACSLIASVSRPKSTLTHG